MAALCSPSGFHTTPQTSFPHSANQGIASNSPRKGRERKNPCQDQCWVFPERIFFPYPVICHKLPFIFEGNMGNINEPSGLMCSAEPLLHLRAQTPSAESHALISSPISSSLCQSWSSSHTESDKIFTARRLLNLFPCAHMHNLHSNSFLA